jgi:hypothetical protein
MKFRRIYEYYGENFRGVKKKLTTIGAGIP